MNFSIEEVLLHFLMYKTVQQMDGLFFVCDETGNAPICYKTDINSVNLSFIILDFHLLSKNSTGHNFSGCISVCSMIKIQWFNMYGSHNSKIGFDDVFYFGGNSVSNFYTEIIVEFNMQCQFLMSNIIMYMKMM